QAEDGIRDSSVTGVQTCALPIYSKSLSNATGSGVTFSTTFGSSRAPFPSAERVRTPKMKTAAANLISVIKRSVQADVNAQRLSGICFYGHHGTRPDSEVIFGVIEVRYDRGVYLPQH